MASARFSGCRRPPPRSRRLLSYACSRPSWRRRPAPAASLRWSWVSCE